MCKVFIIIFIFLVDGMFAQKFSDRSCYEKRWAFFHPFAALKVKKIYKKCLPYYETMKKSNALDSFESGGKLDAYRHAFFMAAFTQKIKIRKIRKLGIAHEKGNYKHFLNGINEQGELPDSLSSVMDLQNNELGFVISEANKKTSLNILNSAVVFEIVKGKALYFKRNTSGLYLTCDEQIIILDNYRNKWFIPKCLIPTNN